MSRGSRHPLRRPGRGAGAVNLGTAFVVLVVLLPALLAAGSAAPPPAAEFAPSADQVIEEAPADQAADVSGSGDAVPEPEVAEPGPSASPTPEPSPTETVIVTEDQAKRCVGPPPLRQTEDPQSPPCIAFWQGDNGGATAPGVTRESIYVAVPTPESREKEYQALANFFNDRYQFYGRKMVLQFCASSDKGTGSDDEANQRADAALAASGCGTGTKPFASAMYRALNGPYYIREMGCAYQVIAVGTYAPYDSRFLNTCAPYSWQYSMEVDEEFANFGEWTCKRLVGRPAQWAAGNDSQVPIAGNLADHERKFGVILEPFTDDDPVSRRDALDPIVDRIRGCGGTVDEEDILVGPVSGSYNAADAQNAILQLRQDDVTTIICQCNFFSFGTLQRAAEAVSYYPEWVTGTFGLNDVESSFRLGVVPPTQMVRTFGLTFNPRVVDPITNPYNQAVQEGDPSVQPLESEEVQARLEIYRGLSIIAAGIQMAGPNLTVESFRDGLRRAEFPNPDTAAKAGDVDIRPDGFSFTADAAEWWWSTEHTGPFTTSSPGTTCYIGGGTRHRLGEWPEGDAPFFDGTCE